MRRPGAFAFLAVPLFADQYLYTEVLIPVLILSLAAIGLNILTGYCGQLSLGTGGFMAVGAYAPTICCCACRTPT